MLHHPQGSGVGSPHTSGDGPSVGVIPAVPPPFTPRAWGWSDLHDLVIVELVRSPHMCGDGPMDWPQAQEMADVLPTCVGMVQRSDTGSYLRWTFSPRAWGWSGLCGVSETC